MKEKHKKLLKASLILVFIQGLIGLSAQVAVIPSGGNASGTGGTVSSTVGLINYSSLTTSSGKVTEGVQHSYEILISTSTKDTKRDSIILSVYPNPTADVVLLSILSVKESQYSYSLHDNNGKLLLRGTALNKETTISMKSLIADIYLLNVYDGKNLLKSFKIIKK